MLKYEYHIVELQGLSQDLETGCQKLAIGKFWGQILFFKEDHNLPRLQP